MPCRDLPSPRGYFEALAVRLRPETGLGWRSPASLLWNLARRMFSGGMSGDYALYREVSPLWARWYKNGGSWMGLKELRIVHSSLFLNNLALQYPGHEAFCIHALLLETTRCSYSAMLECSILSEKIDYDLKWTNVLMWMIFFRRASLGLSLP